MHVEGDGTFLLETLDAAEEAKHAALVHVEGGGTFLLETLDAAEEVMHAALVHVEGDETVPLETLDAAEEAKHAALPSLLLCAEGGAAGHWLSAAQTLGVLEEAMHDALQNAQVALVRSGSDSHCAHWLIHACVELVRRRAEQGNRSAFQCEGSFAASQVVSLSCACLL